MKFFIPLAFVLSTCFCSVIAQISPPGLDGANLANWGAVGFGQDLGSHWKLKAYLGLARGSDPNDWNPLKKQHIAVYNHEIGYQFSPAWQVSLASSIRCQNQFEEVFPYEKRAYRWEIRHYGRIYRKQQLGKWAMTYSFRPEFRTFYASSWAPSPTPVELRFRLKWQAGLPLNKQRSNFLLGANEWLSTIDKYTLDTPVGHEYRWSRFQFTEDRLSLYFRHVFRNQDLILDLGIMEQFKLGNDFDTISYLAFDLLFQNPFSKNR